ncbi:MAG: T9SS type A sorting domain-containing protein, partial [Bacteroidia bacterium]|nr:T9SS type A sorting domain-containing protein [Bacteroidia bacterium]
GYKNQSDSGMYLVYFFEMFPAQAEMKFTSVMTSSPNSFSPEENFNDFTAVCTDDDTYPAVCPILSDVGVVIFETNATVSSLYYDIRTTLLKTDEVKPAAAIKLYPNPSKDYLHIELMQAPTSQTILIRNYTGRIVKEFSITNEKATLDITDLSQGVYWLQDQNGGSYRFLKM